MIWKGRTCEILANIAGTGIHSFAYLKVMKHMEGQSERLYLQLLARDQTGWLCIWRKWFSSLCMSQNSEWCKDLMRALFMYRIFRFQAVKDVVMGLGRPALHARTLAFDHPSSGRRMFFQSDIPSDFSNALQALRVLP